MAGLSAAAARQSGFVALSTSEEATTAAVERFKNPRLEHSQIVDRVAMGLPPFVRV
jgi:hypothetical protein